jgi:hypothetical protein
MYLIDVYENEKRMNYYIQIYKYSCWFITTISVSIITLIFVYIKVKK